MHLAFWLPDRAQSGNGGGTDYVRGLAAALRDLGHAVDLLHGHESPIPEPADLVVDGMVLPLLADRWSELRPRLRAALVHHISAAAGRDDGARDRIRATEAALLPDIPRVIATSKPVADRLAAEFGVAARAVTPGARDLPRSGHDNAAPLLLAVGVLTRRKAHDRLLHALARLTDLPWRAIIAGDASREPAHAAELAASIDELGLAHTCQLLPDPEPDALEHAWRSAGLFVSASKWEGYPSAIAEALRRGLPVVATDSSNASDLLPPEAGLIVAHDDTATFGKCLRRMLFDAEIRRDMADAAWRAGQALPDWRQQAQRFLSALEE